MRALLAFFVATAVLQTGCGSADKPSGPSGGAGGSAGSGGGGAGGGAAPDAASASMDAAEDMQPLGGAGGQTDASPDGSSGGDVAALVDTGPVADTWDNFAQGFFATYCVACHDDDKKGVATRDYHLLANVIKEKAEIACGVSSAAEWTKRGCTAPPARQFPIGNGAKPTDAERDRLVRWIDSGTP
jgi:cytochrome c553